MNTKGLRVDFGKHHGELWTRVPVSYLKWLVNAEIQNEDTKIAKAELDRRGTVVDKTVELTPHAIDRASLFCRDLWHKTGKKGEGLYTWLHRIAQDALDSKQGAKIDRIHFKSMAFCFRHGEEWPVLKTIIRLNDKPNKYNFEEKDEENVM